MLTKKNILRASFTVTLFLVLLVNILQDTSISICPYEVTLNCTILLFALELFIFMPIFFFSLITYKMRDEIFLSWRKFSFIYLFIYLFIVLISPWMHADFSPFEKKSNALFLVALYSAISLILIAYKSYQLRKK